MSMTTTLFINKDIVEINRDRIEELKRAAQQDDYKRARICLHNSPADPIHEMLIVMQQDSYARPHRNVRNSKSYYMIEGEMYIVFFDESGRVTQKNRISTNTEFSAFICRINTNLWHTVVPLSESVVFIETNGGPFIKENEEYGDWSPKDGDRDGIRLFLHRVKNND